MKKVALYFRMLVIAGFAVVAGIAQAFMPAGGLWVIDDENNGQPGRGFQLEVENETLVFTYYGYRADGSGVFYLAAGPIQNNVFTGVLTEYRGGRPLGGALKPATSAGTVGNVRLEFTSGLHGSITLPGESSLAISKFGFGYPAGPDGLLGTWLMTYVMVNSTTIVNVTELYGLSIKVGTSTSTGNGVVTNSARTVACEFQTSGTWKDTVLCSETGALSNYPDIYIFKFSGEHGSGIGGFYYPDGASSNKYPAYVSRIGTMKGVATGVNEGTSGSLLAKHLSSTSSSSDTQEAKKYFGSEAVDKAKFGAMEDSAVQKWIGEIKTIIQ